MLSQPGLWLIIVGTLLMTFGFFGFTFGQNRQGLDHVTGEQVATPPINPAKPFGKKRAEGMIVVSRLRNPHLQNATPISRRKADFAPDRA